MILLSAAPAFSAGVQAAGELIKVEAEGFAPIKGGDKNGARDAAKRSAYRDALEKALGAYVTGITEMQNFEVVKDKVFSQTTGYSTSRRSAMLRKRLLTGFSGPPCSTLSATRE